MVGVLFLGLGEISLQIQEISLQFQEISLQFQEISYLWKNLIFLIKLYMSKNTYVCPRCNHATGQKIGMVRHFNRKNICPDRNDLSLSPEIIEIVLQNHEYHPPKKDKPKSITNIITNYNTMNNFIAQMDSGDKIHHLLEYQNKKTLDFEAGLETKFEKRVERLENDKYRSGYFLSQDDLVGLIDDITKIDKKQFEKLNVLFDKAVKRFKFYRGKDWESHLEDLGAKELVSLIKSYYLDTYEIYLIRNLHQDEGPKLDRSKLKEHLEVYYQFISIFDLMPHVQDFSDIEIVGHNLIEHNEQYLAGYYFDVYFKQKEQIKLSEKNRVKRRIINIVKDNTIHNLSKLNQTVLEILKVDESFKEVLLKSQYLTNGT